MIKVFIPTYKRLNRQPTLQALNAAGVATVLIVRPEEAQGALDLAQRLNLGNAQCTVYTLPEGITNLAQTRQVLMENVEDDVVFMMDDDLSFAVRGKRADNPLYLSAAEASDVQEMVKQVYYHCEKEGLAGVSMREGNNRKEEEVEYCSRMCRAWAVHMPTFRAIGAKFEQYPSVEDFDITLQFLLAGKRNAVLNNFTTNQFGSNTEGGCSEYRTMDVQKEAAEALARKYPLFVKTVSKETKTKVTWGGQTRIDVHVQWKKAYKEGLKNVK
jgi:ssDNA-binding Zn-finger/Zn-ribbon topoisomerase 1